MDESYDSEDRRRTRTIFSVPAMEDLNESESMDQFEYSLNKTFSKVNEDAYISEEGTVSASENDSYCGQLRQMTPKKIIQLLDKLELNDVRLTSDEVPENNQVDENYQENTQLKKGKPTKVIKNEPKKIKGKKNNDLEQNDEEELIISTKGGASKKVADKSEKPKRGQKQTADVERSNNKDSNKVIVNSKSTESVPPEILNDKKPNKSKAKKANDLEQNDQDEPISTKIGASKKETAKTEKLKRGQKEVADAEVLSSKDSNQTVVNSKSTDSIPPEILNSKKPNKSKGKKANELEHDDKEELTSTMVGASKEETTKTEKLKRGQKKPTADGDNLNNKDSNETVVKVNELEHDDKEELSSTKVGASTVETTKTERLKRGQKKPTADVDNLNGTDSNEAVVNSKSTESILNEVLNDKKSNKSKKAGNGKGKEATLNEKSAKKTANGTDDIKKSKTTKPTLLSITEGKTISTRTRANKSPIEVKPVQEVTKPNKVKKTLLEKETIEKPKRKVNEGKQKITEISEDKENKSKNTNVKAKSEPTKKEKSVDTKKNTTLAAEPVITKRAIRKK